MIILTSGVCDNACVLLSRELTTSGSSTNPWEWMKEYKYISEFEFSQFLLSVFKSFGFYFILAVLPE